MTAALIAACDDYLGARTGHYGYRRIRYGAAADVMAAHGLTDDDTVLDVAAGWTEFGYLLHAERDWRGRYWPVDGGLDGTDLEVWVPPRPVEWAVALEIVEHLWTWERLVRALQEQAVRGVVISTPNPETTDVLGMDETHVRPVWRRELEALGFRVEPRSFYGKPEDSLFAWWLR